jgi:hypothetical protein
MFVGFDELFLTKNANPHKTYTPSAAVGFCVGFFVVKKGCNSKHRDTQTVVYVVFTVVCVWFCFLTDIFDFLWYCYSQ